MDGKLSLSDPQADQAFDTFCRGVRSKTLRRLLLVLMLLLVAYKQRDDLYREFERYARERGYTPDFVEFMEWVPPSLVGGWLRCSEGTARSYLAAARNVAIVLRGVR